MKNVEEAARGVLARQAQKRTGRVSDVWTIEGFSEEIANNPVPGGEKFSETDARVLLRFMERDLKEISFDGSVCPAPPSFPLLPPIN